MGLSTSHLPPGFASQRRRLLVALAGDLVVLVAVFSLAIWNGTGLYGRAEPPLLVLPQTATPAQDTVEAPNLASLEADVRAALADVDMGQVGVSVVDSGGAPVLGINAEQPFVLASVSKIYLLVAYLDQLYQRQVKVSDADMELLQPMIQVSDNASATAIWKKVGREEGLATFLESKGLAPVGQMEDDAWGTLVASAGQVAELLWRLTAGQLLDPESTQLAMALLADIHEEQAWGISAGADDPSATIFLKNGWYPEEDGWRVNSAGTVQAPDEGYVLVVFSYPDDSLYEGIMLVEEVARRVNGFMSR